MASFTLMQLWTKEAKQALSPTLAAAVDTALVRRTQRLPRLMRSAFTLLTLWCWVACALRFFTVSNLSLDQRHALLLNARNSRIGPVTDFYLFTERLTVLHFADELGSQGAQSDKFGSAA
jgi:hypothetical protein